MNLLKISNFFKSYKDSNFSIENFNLTISGGEVIGLIGNNGSGKSSIINSLVGNRKYDSGDFEFLSHKWEPNSHCFKENLGVAFDNNRLSKELNVKQLNIVFKNLYSTWDSSYYYNLINKFNLPTKQIIKNFSRGMLMKLSIAVAMSHDTKLLILDESTAGIDISSRNEILDMLKTFSNNNNAIIITSHISSDLDTIATKLVFLKNGKKILEMKKDSLFNNYCVKTTKKDEFHNVSKKGMLAFIKKGDVIKYITKKDESSISINSLEDISYIIVEGEVVCEDF
ncbi:ABC transporter ATP-binding protein [Staphylococcus xylosus]|uniref:ATP-binding cassette domain-containing protein n=1 Tax=Staphylococcus xylosus TaxID=1288 RepID=UPI00086C3D56|nr:ABC transporter ATP-binding protein [Staphylococcus xylosus]MCA2500425.1 ABC transporter ATP-binding protein [Staphylococcus xylosus]MCA2502237.1 ABC transporter ATP-binding protein [Staphylococcus xylosus]MCE7780136.1 ABC transporter ATP-binding protein [Staphylococcus xylosus]OEK80668.1 hypothetical protein AST16_02955 [Staphylococcus xylosus]OEK85390.1 hypothetical protein AST17_09820 [Staphylococcus xylosus]